jgi:hypothetical protein
LYPPQDLAADVAAQEIISAEVALFMAAAPGMRVRRLARLRLRQRCLRCRSPGA